MAETWIEDDASPTAGFAQQRQRGRQKSRLRLWKIGVSRRTIPVKQSGKPHDSSKQIDREAKCADAMKNVWRQTYESANRALLDECASSQRRSSESSGVRIGEPGFHGKYFP
jgi:hypothetical protein